MLTRLGISCASVRGDSSCAVLVYPFLSRCTDYFYADCALVQAPGTGLLPNNKKAVQKHRFYTPSRARTADKLIKSQLLYQLS